LLAATSRRGDSAMGEPIFLKRGRTLTLAQIAELTGATAPDQTVAARAIANVAPLDAAGPADLVFFDKPRFSIAAGKTHAGACLTTAALVSYLPARVVALIVREPYRAFVTVAHELFPESLRPSSLYEGANADGAHVHPQARLEPGVIVDPGAVIGPRAEIGGGTIIGANAVIAPDVRIGRECAIGAGCVINHALIGDRVIVHPGAKIGQDGFGFIMAPAGHLKVPQLGRVIIQDDVEIGAGTTIDRGAIRDTVIGQGTKIDNLVQVGHNVSMGRYCIVAAKCGISGSSTLGDFVALGGDVGVSDHVTIGEGAQLAAASNVHADVPPGARWGGFPAKPAKQWLREIRVLARLSRAKDGPKDGSSATADE
jgi:UDP-3-O-[3-hydroxymyristoyl] glucosamine N-acyltransferase